MPNLIAKQIDGTYYYARYCHRVNGKRLNLQPNTCGSR
jgi:hypothetical protein